MTAFPLPVAQNKTILIVDDTPANLGLMVSYLEPMGFDVVTAQDGAEALLRAQFVQPDVILLDIMLPGMDGIETCRRMKAIASISAIPVIFMSALTETKKKVEGFAAGGADYVTKPFQIDEVLARITTQLQLRAMHQQLFLQNLALQKEMAKRENLEHETQKQSSALIDLHRRKDEFLAMLGHELRNPLAPLSNAVDLLRLQKNDDPIQLRVRSIIERQVGQLTHLVNDLLEVSRITTGMIQLRPERITANDVVERALAFQVMRPLQ